MNKCDKCNKVITKKNPGMECSKCEKIVHGTTQCSGLTSKQLSALRAADNLEWMCQECRLNTSKRRSFIIPEADDDANSDQFCDKHNQSVQINVKQLLSDIAQEVEMAVKREMRELTISLQFHTEKIDDMVESMESLKKTIQELKKKNVDLSNKNIHLETRIGALEQRIHEIEQENLTSYVEITNVPSLEENQNPMEIVKKLANHINASVEEVECAMRRSSKNDKPGVIIVKLKSEKFQEKWLDLYKGMAKSETSKIRVRDIIPSAQMPVANNPIYLNEALTPFNKRLLWNAKQDLKENFKYIWCKKGLIRVRKEGVNEKSIIIRSLEDIKKLQ